MPSADSSDAMLHVAAGAEEPLAILRADTADVLVVSWDDGVVRADGLCRGLRLDTRTAATWVIGLVDGAAAV